MRRMALEYGAACPGSYSFKQRGPCIQHVVNLPRFVFTHSQNRRSSGLVIFGFTALTQVSNSSLGRHVAPNMKACFSKLLRSSKRAFCLRKQFTSPLARGSDRMAIIQAFRAFEIANLPKVYLKSVAHKEFEQPDADDGYRRGSLSQICSSTARWKPDRSTL